MRPDVNTCSSQPAMHHGVPVRVLFRRSSEHHSRNGSRIGTSWSHDSHVFSHSRTLVVPGIFLRVLYNNIHHHVAFARELEEKEKNTEQDQPAVRFIFHLVVEWSTHETERPRVKKSRRRYISSNGK